MYKKILSSSLFKNSSIYTLDFSMQILVQICYIFIISKYLGPISFGIFSSVVAISIIASTLVGVGCDQVLIRNVSKSSESVQLNYGHGLYSIFLTFPPIGCLVLIFIYEFIDTGNLSELNLLFLISSDLLFTKIVFLSKSCFASHEIVSNQLYINLITTVLKLITLIFGLYAIGSFDLILWSYLYFISNLCSAIISYLFVVKKFGIPKFIVQFRELKLGFQFSLEQLSLTSIKDIDKPIIAYLGGAELAGVYSIAFRIADSSTAPIRGVLYALYVRYFKLSKAGGVNVLSLTIRTLPLLLFVGLILGLLIYFCSQWVSDILGSQYSQVSEILRLFCIYPLLFLILGTVSDLLRVLDRQHIRTILSVVGAIAMPISLYFGFNNFGIEGAVYAKLLVLLLISISSLFFIRTILVSACSRSRWFRITSS